MNRLQQVELAYRSHYSHSQGNKAGSVIGSAGPTNQRFFIPLHYEENYSYPLLVWLHGPTGSEIEVAQVMPHISTRNYVAVGPRGGVRHSASHPNGDPTFTWNQQPGTIERALDDVLKCVAAAKRRFNICQGRVFLAGNDVGGTMALRIALSCPRLFAGVASIGGALPKDRLLSKIDQVRSIPILISQGQASSIYSTEEVCDDLRLLHAAGMSVTLRQYPCEHEVTTQMLSDLNVWLMEQIAGSHSDAITLDDPTHLRVQHRN